MEIFVKDLSILLVAIGLMATLAVFLKQPIVVAYVVCGILIGPWGAGWIKNIGFIESISHLGITLLLFLAGLNLHPQKLIRIFRKTTLVTLLTSLISFLLAFFTSLIFDFQLLESFCIGLSLMFSSTILTVKLIPTTELHHERMGAACIGVLILQDLWAVAILAFLRCLDGPGNALWEFVLLSVKLTCFIGALVFFEIFILRNVMKMVDRLQEVLFLLGLAWCFGVASISNQMGLFYESGAFFAGVVLAAHPIANFIAEKLKPLRDFFLVLFFFSLGANLNLHVMQEVLWYAVIMAGLFIVIKPLAFKTAFVWSGEKPKFSQEAGIRMGQLSEFGFLIAMLAFDLKLIGLNASQFIQLVTILTFILSSYLVVYTYPTPIGISEKTTRD